MTPTEQKFWLEVFMAVLARSSAATAATEANSALKSFRAALAKSEVSP